MSLEFSPSHNIFQGSWEMGDIKEVGNGEKKRQEIMSRYADLCPDLCRSFFTEPFWTSWASLPFPHTSSRLQTFAVQQRRVGIAGYIRS